MRLLDHFPPDAYRAQCPLTGKVDGAVLDTGIKVVEDGWPDRSVCLSIEGAHELGQFAGMASPQEVAALTAQVDDAAAELEVVRAELDAALERAAQLEAELAAQSRAAAEQIAALVAEQLVARTTPTSSAPPAARKSTRKTTKTAASTEGTS